MRVESVGVSGVDCASTGRGPPWGLGADGGGRGMGRSLAVVRCRIVDAVFDEPRRTDFVASWSNTSGIRRLKSRHCFVMVIVN